VSMTALLPEPSTLTGLYSREATGNARQPVSDFTYSK
jgi:hypothetical protein